MKPFSRRSKFLACRRSDKSSAYVFGRSNDAFLLDDLPSSSCRQSHVADAPTVACTSDRHDTDDDGQSATNCRSSSYVSSSKPSNAADDADRDRPSTHTTCALIERSSSTSDLVDNKQPASDECNVPQQSILACIHAVDFS